MHKHWIDKGDYRVAHFLNEEGKILSHIDFQRKFDITIDFVTYFGRKLAIKKFLRNSVSNSVITMLLILRRACRNCMKQIRVANHIMMY